MGTLYYGDNLPILPFSERPSTVAATDRDVQESAGIKEKARRAISAGFVKRQIGFFAADRYSTSFTSTSRPLISSECWMV